MKMMISMTRIMLLTSDQKMRSLGSTCGSMNYKRSQVRKFLESKRFEARRNQSIDNFETNADNEINRLRDHRLKQSESRNNGSRNHHGYDVDKESFGMESHWDDDFQHRDKRLKQSVSNYQGHSNNESLKNNHSTANSRRSMGSHPATNSSRNNYSPTYLLNLKKSCQQQ